MKSLVLLLALTAPALAMDVKSHDMAEGALLSTQQVYTDCNGDNVSPGLAWSGAPAGAKSFAVTLYDPDAHPNGWWHWIVFDIPASATSLVRGAGGDPSQLPAGAVQGQNDFSASSYGGACPPPGSGVHHYQFTVWALDTASLPFDTNVTGNTIGPWLKKHALGQAVLTPVYQR
jgi:Raf kinase inhibitor-like YbhB/YbcL family protein